MIRAALATVALGLSCAIAQAQVYTTLDDPASPYGTQPFGISGSNIVGYYEDSSGNTQGRAVDEGGCAGADDAAVGRNAYILRKYFEISPGCTL